MQTFLPFPDFKLSAESLDDKRLGKQRVENKQIYLALTESNYGWKNHPAVRMWKGYENALTWYAYEIITAWMGRGFDDNTLIFWSRHDKRAQLPWWFGREEFHRSHRSALIRKKPEWYREKLGWDEPDIQYIWPYRDIFPSASDK